MHGCWCKCNAKTAEDLSEARKIAERHHRALSDLSVGLSGMPRHALRLPAEAGEGRVQKNAVSTS
jgi:hypothetical protein